MVNSDDMAKTKRKPGLLAGAKTNKNSHSTLIAEAMVAVKIAKLCPHISKISLGLIKSIKPLRGPDPHLKFVQMTGGLRMQVRGQDSVQYVWIYTTMPEETIAFINERWNP
jgi:hypothetical protein